MSFSPSQIMGKYRLISANYFLGYYDMRTRVSVQAIKVINPILEYSVHLHKNYHPW